MTNLNDFLDKKLIRIWGSISSFLIGTLFFICATFIKDLSILFYILGGIFCLLLLSFLIHILVRFIKSINKKILIDVCRPVIENWKKSTRDKNPSHSLLNFKEIIHIENIKNNVIEIRKNLSFDVEVGDETLVWIEFCYEGNFRRNKVKSIPEFFSSEYVRDAYINFNNNRKIILTYLFKKPYKNITLKDLGVEFYFNEILRDKKIMDNYIIWHCSRKYDVPVKNYKIIINYNNNLIFAGEYPISVLTYAADGEKRQITYEAMDMDKGESKDISLKFMII